MVLSLLGVVMASSVPAYLYVIADGSGAHKVGLSGAPRRRLSQLQSGSPRRLTLVRTSADPFAHPDEVEAYAHWLLREAQELGEWFNVTEDAAWVALVAAAEAVARGERAPVRIGGGGRRKEWEKRLTLPLTSEMVERLDAAREPGEDRLTVIRKGIERELKARARPKAEKGA